MDVINEKVSHELYGAGRVTAQTPSTVTVRFERDETEKRFLYPSAFELFLSLEDPEAGARMSRELSELRQKREAERLAQEEAEALRRQEERLALLAEKRAALKKRAPAKKSAKTAAQ